jgi:hypothetical protein
MDPSCPNADKAKGNNKKNTIRSIRLPTTKSPSILCLDLKINVCMEYFRIFIDLSAEQRPNIIISNPGM